jgi:hypothetical protein
MANTELDEFIKSFRPAAVPSRVAPHLEGIRQLRALGYSLKQVTLYLASKGVTISVSGLSALLRRKQERLAMVPDNPPPLPRSTNASDPLLSHLQPSTRPIVDIDQIGSRKVDLDALARLARSTRN